MKHVTIIGTSLNEESKSQLLAETFETHLLEAGYSCERIDLRLLALPFSGSGESWGSSNASNLKASVDRSSHVVFAVPIYCYDVNSAAKNVIELIGQAFTRKVVSFICSAGGSSSYMSVMGFANHLMLDFRSVVVPRFIYVDDSGWDEGLILKPEIEDRMNLLLDDMREIQVVEVNS
jgi:FMN reductase